MAFGVQVEYDAAEKDATSLRLCLILQYFGISEHGFTSRE